MGNILTAVQKIFNGLIQGLESWKFLCYGAVLTGTLISAGHIPVFSGILTAMYKEILPYLIIAFLAFFSGIVVKIGSVLCAKYQLRAKKRKLIETLLSLSESEIAVMKYVLSRPSDSVWLPVENIDVLSLYSRKILFPIFNTSSLRGFFPALEQCFAYSVAEVIRNYYREHGEEINKSWNGIAEAANLKIYE